MIHDMALTARYLVLVLAPAFFDIAAAMSGGSLIAWRPERGCRIALIPRDGSPVRWAQDEAYMAHGERVRRRARAGRRGAPGVRPVVAAQSGRGPSRRALTSHLVRTVIDPARRTMRRTVLDETRLEFPRIDDRALGRRHRHIGIASESGRVDLLPGEFDGISWYGTSAPAGGAGSGVQKSYAGDFSVGEPVFAPSPGDTADDRGYWLTYATDRTDAPSRLLVFPAEDPASGPVAPGTHPRAGPARAARDVAALVGMTLALVTDRRTGVEVHRPCPTGPSGAHHGCHARDLVGRDDAPAARAPRPAAWRATSSPPRPSPNGCLPGDHHACTSVTAGASAGPGRAAPHRGAGAARPPERVLPGPGRDWCRVRRG
ncbi:carotenoid oxygenase family protein [Streptomyces sp. NPDC059909]|uniref:carotenoid oxygenase family protein n=1 Tax=Streptomyces sp. NPDC059909 TaxID=3346998 RepID=UPI00365A51E5